MMSRGRIPHSRDAVIEPSKLRGYLLSRTHPIGRDKAVFFEQLGYGADNWERLAADLRSQHLTRAARELVPSAYGRKYEIRAPLTGPSGRTVRVVSVWIVRTGEKVPRFVTAYGGETR